MNHKPRVLIRGGGDLASGVAARLHRVGFGVLVVELAHPLVVRRMVSFAEAVFSGLVQVEEITGQLVTGIEGVKDVFVENKVAVMVDAELNCLNQYSPLVLIDARMKKYRPEYRLDIAPIVIGLGPGFKAGANCHAVIETMRGHHLGRVIWEGEAYPNTGIPDAVSGKTSERVVRAPKEGVLTTVAEIGMVVSEGDVLASVGNTEIRAPFAGVVRGLMKGGSFVQPGFKIGDLDPRGNPDYAHMISDKSMAIAGGVLEAILSKEEIRNLVYAPD